MDNVVTYLIITGISICPLALYNGCVTLFRAMGDSKMTIHISLLMNLMNLIGNICFKKRVTARPDMEQIKRILYIGIPNGLENSLYHLTPETENLAVQVIRYHAFMCMFA